MKNLRLIATHSHQSGRWIVRRARVPTIIRRTAKTFQFRYHFERLNITIKQFRLRRVVCVCVMFSPLFGHSNNHRDTTVTKIWLLHWFDILRPINFFVAASRIILLYRCFVVVSSFRFDSIRFYFFCVCVANALTKLSPPHTSAHRHRWLNATPQQTKLLWYIFFFCSCGSVSLLCGCYNCARLASEL